MWSYEEAEETLCWVMDHCADKDCCYECPINGHELNQDCARFIIEQLSGIERENARNVAEDTGAFQCSECGYNGELNPWFCPSCGARVVN